MDKIKHKMEFQASRIGSNNLFILVPILMIPVTVFTAVSYMALEYIGFNDQDRNIYCAVSTYIFSVLVVFYASISDIWNIKLDRKYAIRGLIVTSVWVLIIMWDCIVLQNQTATHAYDTKISLFRGVAYGVWCGLFMMWMVNLRNLVRSVPKR